MTGGLRRSAVAGVAAVVIVVAAVVVVFAGLGVSRATTRGDDRATVLGIAREDAVDFTTYDYQHLEADFARFAARATGALHTQYATFTPDLAARFRTLKVQSQGQVVSAGVVSQSATTATVLVAVNDTIRNAKVPKGQIVYDRLAFELQKVGDAWLASGVHEL